ncbi:hypothetical protein GGS23DRAFT_610860 [Durotheca rogersii]|uniref:uncharacterized protein n=1 Tax=Durotheca rogersii TaxID=419775 RepID=UPI00221FAEF5|nr:uncharacterized protein GGS23DRAFT_610860 [Durotheca rogersii]KAI5862186.1 hypothetical protein GGS23DRAFT_610860 [Durotheca rogersii]
MKLPYQCLSRLGPGSIFCAARGASICTFDLGAEPPFVASWTHPLARAPPKAAAAREEQEPAEQGGDQPPPKKRRLDPSEDRNPPDAEGADGKAAAEAAPPAPDGGAQEVKPKPKPKPKHNPRGQGSELPFVTILAATEDGSHVVAVTGQDKTLWTFEHDGGGVLKELSQRAMPKRPSSVAITSTASGLTILCADKFGDVYALPLVPSASPAPPPSADPATPTPISAGAPPAGPAKPAANRFTVHSKRNLRALEEQQRLLANRPREPAAAASRDGPAFAHELVLGHVSMLTALVVASFPPPTPSSSSSSAPASPSSAPAPSGAGATRPYIITGDRDEHIRVSRGLPQAHVVEGYCLGHAAFVAALCAPPSRPGRLVSAGGDDHLLLWDWPARRLLRRVDLLARARALVPDAPRVAASRLYSYVDGGGSDPSSPCYVLAICELVPALFIFELPPDGSTLAHVQTLALPGVPLDAVVVPQPPPATEAPPLSVLVVAVDPRADQEEAGAGAGMQAELDSPSHLLLYEREGPHAATWVRRGAVAAAGGGRDHLDISRAELDAILYPVGNLRKTEFELEDDAEGPPAPGLGEEGAEMPA